MKDHTLGDRDTSEDLLRDLYVDLRRRLLEWSSLTHQTPQARMGYVGQHLTSVVTGYPGGRSGARGHDIVLPDAAYAEVKTCYRVDQLGSCNQCGGAVANTEETCAFCGSSDIARKDDSKWLITIRNEDELRSLFDPAWYYLVLFDFDDPKRQLDINARIWRVNPRRPGFALCMVDYYFNIKQKSQSGAPFNLWPFSAKFYLMAPELIYQSTILTTDEIVTSRFPTDDEPRRDPIVPVSRFFRSRTLKGEIIRAAAKDRGINLPERLHGKALFEAFDAVAIREAWGAVELADELSLLVYTHKVEEFEQWVPTT